MYKKEREKKLCVNLSFDGENQTLLTSLYIKNTTK